MRQPRRHRPIAGFAVLAALVGPTHAVAAPPPALPPLRHPAADEHSVNPLPSNRPDAHPYWLNDVRVTDAAATAARITALGGRVVLSPQPDRQGGKIAVAVDPPGAPFGVMEWTDDADAGTAK